MNLPEKSEMSPFQNISGDNNQSIGSMADGSKAVGRIYGNVYFNENLNQITLPAMSAWRYWFCSPVPVLEPSAFGESAEGNRHEQ
jgi:hypothetical protein